MEASNALPSDEEEACVAFLGERNRGYSTESNSKLACDDVWSIKINVGNVSVPMKLDTGADVSLIGYDYFCKLNPVTSLHPSKNI